MIYLHRQIQQFKKNSVNDYVHMIYTKYKTGYSKNSFFE